MVRHGSRIVRGPRAAAHAAALLLGALLPWRTQAGVIPLPAQIVPGDGAFPVGPGTVLEVPARDRDAGAAAGYLAELWSRTNGFTLPVRRAGSGADASANVIEFRRRAGLGPEAYAISIAEQRIRVSAGTAAGLFYGAVTLWQLLPPDGAAGRIPAQSIRDAPAYAWRGLLLDSARHFQSPDFIRAMIDWMAWHKLNVLHWHLTDDQGWRLEIPRYPRLTSVGAWRIEPDGARYGGFYTQAEVRDIVRFAAARHVRIVPEIDLPGHATAAIAAYPWLGAAVPAAGAAAPAVSARWGVHTHLLNLDERTFRFLEDVLADVTDLFPSRIIHIGGDEVVKDEWSGSPEVEARARALGLHDPDTLQAYFTQRLGRYLAARGRRIIGWDEILRPDLPKTALVMSWHGVSGAHAAALAGHDTVLSPDPALYFDHRQSSLPTEPPGRLQVISLEDVYRFEPRDAALSRIERQHVLGLQANLWTEHMQTEARVQWMTWPRAAALAEVAWTPPERRSWPDFLQRLVPLFARYRAFGVHYADSVFAPAAQISGPPDGFSVTLSNQAQSDAPAVGGLRYTVDGSEPTVSSMRYATPLIAAAGTSIRAAAFVGGEQASRTWTLHLDAQTARRRDSHDLAPCSDGVGLLLDPAGGAGAEGGAARAPLAVDIMNPCWIDRGVDLTGGPQVIAAVAALPFNYELGAALAQIRVGDARSAQGELEIHIDGCDAPPSVLLPLAPASAAGVTTLPAQRLPRLPGRHDLCLRFARPRLDPLWALDSIELRE